MMTIPKTLISLIGTIIAVVPAPLLAQPEVLATETNRANNHAYILLSASSWTAARSKAIQLGGDLVVLNDAAEEAFVFTAFSRFDGENRNLWIGLRDLNQSENSTDRAERRLEFSWIDGTPVTYTNWSPSEPNNRRSLEPETWEFFVHIWQPGDLNPGRWNNLQDKSLVFGVGVHGVVEIEPAPAPSALDTDGDGTPNSQDGCPNDPNKTAPGDCGCGRTETSACGVPIPNPVTCCGNSGGAGLGLVSFLVGWKSVSRRRRRAAGSTAG